MEVTTDWLFEMCDRSHWQTDLLALALYEASPEKAAELMPRLDLPYPPIEMTVPADECAGQGHHLKRGVGSACMRCGVEIEA